MNTKYLTPLLILAFAGTASVASVQGYKYFSDQESEVASINATTDDAQKVAKTPDDEKDTKDTSDEWPTCNQNLQTFKPQGEDLTWSEITLYKATSADGKTFGSPEVFVEGGGVPSVTTAADGTTVAVFQWFGEDSGECYGQVAARIIKDGVASAIEPIHIKDFPSIQSPYDPTITTTADGKYRLFFTTHELGMGKTFYYGSAISDDGINYVYEEGKRFISTQSSVVDGSEVRVGDTWYMLAARAKENGKAFDAISTDGKNFTEVTSNRSSEMYWVGNMVNDDGTIRFYGSYNGYIGYSSTTDGKVWTDPVATNIQGGGDPGITVTEDGTYMIIYAEPKR